MLRLPYVPSPYHPPSRALAFLSFTVCACACCLLTILSFLDAPRCGRDATTGRTSRGRGRESEERRKEKGIEVEREREGERERRKKGKILEFL